VSGIAKPANEDLATWGEQRWLIKNFPMSSPT
jgi:hypothetical protein